MKEMKPLILLFCKNYFKIRNITKLILLRFKADNKKNCTE